MSEPVYRSVIWFAKGVFRGLGLKFDIVGTENLPRIGGAVLAINHTSYLDFALAGIPADRRGRRMVRFMAKESVFRHPVAGPLMRGMKHIPVDRSAGSAAYDEAVRVLRRGELVGVFPEATMSRSLRIQDIKSGAVRMAREAQVPLIPMIVFGGHRILSYAGRDLTRGRPILITIGEAIDVTGDVDVDTLTSTLRERMEQLLDQTAARYPEPFEWPSEADHSS